MFDAPRFVVIDDKSAHLNAIRQTFERLGCSCLGVHFDAQRGLDGTAFKGVRLLFADLHLTGGEATTDNRRHYAVLTDILETHIDSDCGPFLLVVWTEHAHLKDELIDYLDSSLDPAKPHARPLAVVALPKERFINVDSGDCVAPAALRQSIEEHLQSVPQLGALLQWEADVLSAAGATLATLLTLVRADEQAIRTFPAQIDAILSRLATAAVGTTNVAIDPRAAVAAALAPILPDRIINQALTADKLEIWAKAVTKHTGDQLPPLASEECALINRMLHLANPSSETIRPMDWGAVVEFPASLWDEDEQIERLFGIRKPELLGGEFKIPRADRGRCNPRLIRIGAACDYAQGRKGPLMFLLGMEIPIDVNRADSTGIVRAPLSEWTTPMLCHAGSAPFKLHVNSRYPVTLPAQHCGEWRVCYRLREQLLMTLVVHMSGYVSRPGILQF